MRQVGAAILLLAVGCAPAPRTLCAPEPDILAENHYQAALISFKEGEFERAAIRCRKALELNPRHWAARIVIREVEQNMSSHPELPPEISTWKGPY